MKTLECLLTRVMSKKGVLQVPKVGYAPGELAQMVERPLRMREVPGSIFATIITTFLLFSFFL